MFCKFCPPPLWVRWPFHLKNNSDWDASIGVDGCLCQFALSVSFKETLFGQKKICIVPGKYSLYGSRKNSQCNLQFHKKSILVQQFWNQNLFQLTFLPSPGNFLLLLEEEREEWIAQFLKIFSKTCFNFLFSSNLSSHNYVFLLCWAVMH